jgi:hypothetical protein
VSSRTIFYRLRYEIGSGALKLCPSIGLGLGLELGLGLRLG